MPILALFQLYCGIKDFRRYDFTWMLIYIGFQFIQSLV